MFTKEFQQMIAQKKRSSKLQMYYALTRHRETSGVIWHRLTGALSLNTHTTWGTGVLREWRKIQQFKTGTRVGGVRAHVHLKKKKVYGIKIKT